MTARAVAIFMLCIAGCGGPVEPETAAPADPHAPQQVELGSFMVESAYVLVSDPCYPYVAGKKSSLQAEIEVRKGRWVADATRIDLADWGARCVELLAEFEYHRSKEQGWKLHPAIIGVDSGQAGIFDRKHFQDDSLVRKDHAWKSPPIDPEQPWYSLCCETTLSGEQAGVIPFGVVAASGLGDGAYELYTRADETGTINGLKLVFLSKADLDELRAGAKQENPPPAIR
jgi:hypothetical protein